MNVLFGLTQTSSLMGLVGLVVSLVLVAAGLGALRFRGQELRVSPGRVMVQGIFGFMALWLWFAWTFPIIAWLVWIGDNEHWFWHNSAWIAGSVIVLWHAFVFPRMAQRRISGRFLRFHAMSTFTLWLLAALVYLANFIDPILAADPKRAAEKYIERMAFGEPVTLVEVPINEGEWAHPSQIREFIAHGKEEPRARVAVSKYGKFWWTHARFIGLPSSAQEIRRARELLHRPQDRERARSILQDLINTRPHTLAAKEAEELLQAHGLKRAPPDDLPNGIEQLSKP